MNSILWIIILALLILIEIITLGIMTIWFAVGALIAFIVSLFYHNLILEIILFLAVSLSMLYFTRPIVIKYIIEPKTCSDSQDVRRKTRAFSQKFGK